MENSTGQGKVATFLDNVRGWSVGRKLGIGVLVLLLLGAVAVFVLDVNLDFLDDAPPAKAPPTVAKAPAAKAPVAAPAAPKAPAPAAAPGPATPAQADAAGKGQDAPAAATAGAAKGAPPEPAKPAAAAPEAADAKPSPVAREPVAAAPPGSSRPAPARKRSLPAPVAPAAVEAPVEAPRAPFATPRYNDIMSAVVAGDEAGVRETIAFGMFVDRRDSNGLTPLMVASMRRNLAMARMLLEGGANPHLSAGGGRSAMRFARDNGDAGMVALLRRYGVPEK